MATLPNVYLAHGASGSAASMKPHVDGLAARGLSAHAVQLPRGSVERAMPVYAAAIDGDPGPVIGGHSFGGRVASLLAAERAVRGLVLLSYPLHRPGGSETWDARTAHWARIACPVLILSGESDPFARVALLRQAAARLAQCELATYPGVGHGVGPVLDDALDRIDRFVRGLG
jgi:uncharacterized protein